MSDLCAHTKIKEVCYTDAGGVKTTLLAHYTYATSTGTVPTALVRTVFTNAAGDPVDTTGGTVVVGTCLLSVDDVFRVTAPLVAGNNVITHNLGRSPVEVEVRNADTGAEIAVRVVAETTSTVTIFAAVAVASARISIDA